MSELNVRDASGRIRQEAKEVLLDDIAGRKQWRGSKLGYVTGASFFTSAVAGVASAVRGSAGRIGLIYSGMTKGEDNSSLPSIGETETDAGRRFELAMEAHGKTEADLETIAGNTHRGFFLYAVLLLAVVVIGIGSLRYGNITGMPTFMDVLLRFATVPALAALMIRFGYLNWIIRNRRLGGLAEYLRSGEFFPVRSPGKMTMALLMGSLILGPMVLSPTPAHAAYPTSAQCRTSATSSEPTTLDMIAQPHCDDVFYNLLRFMVPGVGPVDDINKTTAHEAVAAGFTAFSGVLMLLGSLMLGWHVVVGIVQSAYSGKVLGERWHQIWAPSRVVLGIGSLAPIAGGYGAAQVMVVYLVVWGGNLANTIWQPYVSVLGKGITTVSGTPTDSASSVSDRSRTEFLRRISGTEDIIYQIARREVCNAIGNRFYEIEGGSGLFGPDRTAITPDPKMLQDIGYSPWESIKWGIGYAADWLTSITEATVQNSRYSIDYGTICGKIYLDVQNVTKGRDSKDINTLHLLGEEKFDAARLEAIKEVIETLRAPAKEVAQTYVAGGGNAKAFSGTDATRTVLNSFYGQVLKASRAYNKQMLEAAQEQIRNLDTDGSTGQSIVESAMMELNTKGWAVSGAYYVAISQMQSAIYAKAMEKPTFVGLNMDPGEGTKDALISKLIGTPGDPGAMRAFDNWWDNRVKVSFKDIDPLSARAGRDDENADGWFNSLLQYLGTDGMMSLALDSFKDLDPFNPMRAMLDFGHKILMLFWSAISAIAVVAAVGAAASFSKAAVLTKIGGVVSSLSENKLIASLFGMVTTFIGLILMALFAVGIVHAYIIPMIPYIQVLFFLMGMLILVVEALIAAPLWAFFHVRMDGNELVDQMQRPGYMIAFNLLLRPSLMILGLMMSLFVFGAMAWFISKTFTVAAYSASSGHAVGPIGTVVMVCIVCYLHYQIALRAFGLINQVPDRVVRWFGQGGENLGEQNENDKAVGFAVTRIGGKSEELLRGAGAGAMLSGSRK